MRSRRRVNGKNDSATLKEKKESNEGEGGVFSISKAEGAVNVYCPPKTSAQWKEWKFLQIVSKLLKTETMATSLNHR